MRVICYTLKTPVRNYLSVTNKSLLYSFYAIFFLAPLVLFPRTLELFEFNKLFLVYGVSLFVLFLWISKMIMLGKFVCKRTPLDIPLALFLLSQILSTIFSMDPYVSFWGYYTRFNGGLLSLITYIFLYYAFVSNFFDNEHETSQQLKTSKKVDESEEETISKTPSFKIIFVSLVSGLAVAVWGFSSHFGRDLTCLVFRGTFDVSCWTDAFQPTVRLFSTLGQPNWLAAYFSILIPISLGIGIYKLLNYFESGNKIELSKRFLIPLSYILLSFFLFIELLWSQSQSGYLGLLSGLFVFALLTALYFWRKKAIKKIGFYILIPICFAFFILSFIISNPLANRFSFLSIKGFQSTSTSQASPSATPSSIPALEGGGSDSGKIRLVVWTGALDLFKKNPILGSGVETFAYGYYQVKPAEHNLLSEWDYLYNKAHNEYLNYLATTGILGLSTYLLLIAWFIFLCAKYLVVMVKQKTHNSPLHFFLITALLSAYISILVSNFFGFSVVVINLYFFFIPTLAIIIMQKQPKVFDMPFIPAVPAKKTAGIILLAVFAIYMELYLLNLWFADQDYSMGYNLNRAQEYVAANSYLENAVKLAPQEDLFKNELSLNLATLGVLLLQQNQSTQAAAFLERSTQLSDEVEKNHPKNVVFYKTRIQTFFVLSQANPAYFNEALVSIKKARQLAPTDAKIAYNEGLLQGQNGDANKAIEALSESIKLKPNYRDPRYATAIYLQEKADKETDTLQKEKLLTDAKFQLEYILKNINPTDTQSKELLESLNKN